MSRVSILQTSLRALPHEELSRIAAEMAIALLRVKEEGAPHSYESDMDAAEIAEAALRNTMVEAIQEMVI